MKEKYAKNCGECQYIFPREDKKGYCDRLEDPDYVFLVPLAKTRCIYGNPGLKISKEELNQRLKESKLAGERFLENAKKGLRRNCFLAKMETRLG
jgi:hypothetical protein